LLTSQTEAKRPGRYEILRVVNRGGMGEIALGRVTGTKGFEKLVVLKRLRIDAEREDHFEMFDVEQEVMSRIEHPNIVKVFDQPVIDNVQYLAMEYVRGRNLDQVIRQAATAGEQLSLRFTLSAISEVLRGLAFVHRLKDNAGNALGVVHQDMTPSNVMVSFFGEVKVTDFGISYVTSRDGGLRKGVLKGKPRYVAPEVLAGKRVNNQADIYGVGVVLYEMLTGEALFARPSVKDTLGAVARNELPSFEEVLKSSGAGTWKLLRKSLAKEPQDRYRTAEEMAADVFAELTPLGGPLSSAAIAYEMRKLFKSDPDVPEMDPAFETAIVSSESKKNEPATGLSLDQTLEALDKLLGPQSTDVFTLPPDLEMELADISAGEPFLARTPIPDFVWEAHTDAELLERAKESFGPLVRTAPPLFDPAAPPRMPPPKKKEEEEPTAYSHVAPRPRKSSGQYSITGKPSSSPTNAPLEAAPAAPEEGAPAPADPPAAREPVPATEPPSAADRTAPIAPAVTPVPAPVEPAPQAPVSATPDRFWLGIGIGVGIGLISGAMVYAQIFAR
jgi:serine/threonine-protein kinase